VNPLIIDTMKIPKPTTLLALLFCLLIQLTCHKMKQEVKEEGKASIARIR